MTSRETIDMIASLAMIAASVVLIASTVVGPDDRRPRDRAAPTVPVPSDPVSVDELSIVGLRSSPVAIVAFSDYQCPACGAFARETYPLLKTELIDNGQAAFVWRHLPLSQIHPLARRAASSSVCAGRQNHFEGMHASLFRMPLELDENSLMARTMELGLDGEAFRQCMDEPDRQVQTDIAVARQLRIASTPTFLVGAMLSDGRGVKVSRVLRGARTADEFKSAVKSVVDDIRAKAIR